MAAAIDGHALVDNGAAPVLLGLQPWLAAEQARDGAIHDGWMATRYRTRGKDGGRIDALRGIATGGEGAA